MIFDKMCGIIERHFPDYIHLVEKAKVFYLPKSAQEVMSEFEIQNHLVFYDLFQLPYSITAIDYGDKCLILYDLQESALGIDNRRLVLLYCPQNHYLKDNDTYLYVGIIKSAEIKNKSIIMDIDWQHMFLVSKKEKPVDILYHLHDNFKKSKNIEQVESIFERNFNFFMQNINVVINEMYMFSNLNFFILEESPINTKKNKSVKVSRTHQRPLYTILRPHEIREKLNLDAPLAPDRKRGSPIPHERRAHLRRLTKESGYKEDKIVKVKATWIGDSEKIIGNKRYKVILDI